VGAESIERLVEYLRSRGAKEHTVKTYARFARKLLEACPEPTKECALSFLAQYSGKAPLTQATCAYALRAFFEANPDLGVDYRDIPLPSRVEVARKVVVIPEAVIRRVAEAEDIKVGAMIALMYEVGLRVSEVGKLLCGDLDLLEWTVYARRAKGSVSSVLPIVTDWVKDLVRAYATVRACRDPSEPLFPGRSGRGISYTRVSALVKAALAKHGYSDARPHDIRHSRGTNLLKAGVDVVTVAHVLGHKALSSTTRYLHLVVDDIRRKLEEALKRRA